MSNIVKYNLSTSPNSIQSGNFNIGVNDTPTDLTGFYNGISPILSGYTIYIDKPSDGPSIYSPKNDTELIQITNSLGASVATAADALVWINSQSTMTVLNNNYPSIVTDGLVLNLDAGFVSSYPKTGTTWKDLSGNGSNGTLLNGVSYSGTNYGSLVFDGTNDSIQVTTSSTLQLTGLTINIWYNSAVSSNTALTLPTSGSAFILHFRGAGFYLTASDSSVSGYLAWNSPTTNLPANQWLMLTATWDGSTMKLYYNSTKQTSERSFSGGTNNRLRDISAINIGTFFNSSQPWANGNIMIYSLYDRALTQQEVNQNYYAGLQRFIPTDELVLSLDAQNTNLYATSPTTAYDVSGNNNNGTLINGVGYGSYGDGSWSFDGINDYLLLTNSITLSQSSNWTIQGWVASYQTGSAGAFLRIIGDQNSSNNYIFLERNNRLIGRNNSGTTFVFQASFTPALPLDSQFFLLTLVNNNGTLSLYSNTTQTTVNSSVTGDLIFNTIMRERNSYSPGGFVSTFSHYSRNLTLSEITTIYNATKSRYGL
jgi:hypothetical protein